MPKIHVLEKQVAELIAAGAVVERPSSVIKELVENSIDSGASIVTVEIRRGGVTYIRVTDNGCGIAREDVATAFLRHATSKVREKDDLDAILTLGFRGEALASISAVSRVDLITRTAVQSARTILPRAAATWRSKTRAAHLARPLRRATCFLTCRRV